jgi:hypothetical protein
MSKKFRYILVFLILALISAIVVWKYTFRKAEVSMESKKPDFKLEASRLLQEFETNETAANTLYLDKIVVVTGKVASVAEDSVGISVYLKENDALSGIICSFDKTALELSAVDTGLLVSVKGICTGYLMDVVMNKCSLINDVNK